MSGPTREEVEIIESALLDFGDPDGPCNAGPYAKELCGKLDDLSRARHVREAVEGLSEEWIQEYGDVQPFESDCVVLKPEERVRRLADGIAGFRIALLDALTGEGK